MTIKQYIHRKKPGGFQKDETYSTVEVIKL